MGIIFNTDNTCKNKSIERIKDYLKHFINNSWYVNAKLDYNINGYFVDATIVSDGHGLLIEWVEEGQPHAHEIAYYYDYTLEQLYNIWMECEN